MSNQSKNRNGLFFLTGAIAGGTLIYFMQTPRGKKFRNSVVEGAQNAKDTVQERAGEMVETIRTKAGEWIDTATGVAQDTQEHVSDKLEDMAEQGREKMSDFRRGMKMAENNIKHSHTENA